MARFGLIGGFSKEQSVAADAQETTNWYVERVESGQGKSKAVLAPCPGTSQLCNVGGNLGGRGIYTVKTTGRMFSVVGTVLWEITAAGVFTNRGTVVNDGQPASFAASTTQLAVCSGGTLYVLTLSNNTFASASVNAEVVLQIGYSDGFFIALVSNSDKFYVSASLDATTWVATNLAIVSVFPDLILGMKIIQRVIWLFGQSRTIVYYNSGGALFPYDVIPGSAIEVGCGASWSPEIIDNTVVWMGNDDRGPGMFWRAVGYIPQRISTHAIENEIQSYSTRSDAIAYSYQENGHQFYKVNFPTANKTWCWDAATGLWHRRAYFNQITGYEASHSQFHTYNDSFGGHFVTDSKSGRIFQSSVNFPDDAGNPILRVRRSPYIAQEGEWLYHEQIQIDIEAGLGPQPPLKDGSGNPRDPQIMLRWSDTNGKTWSNQQFLNCGQAGNYLVRAIARRLGRSRGRIYEISVTDAIKWVIVEGYLKATPGYTPSQRQSHEMAKVA